MSQSALPPTDELSPMMRQYMRMKEKSGDAILLFRCGDFYEMFMDDAVRGAEALDITLTKKAAGNGQTVPLAGIPYHAAQSYIYRLTRQGFRVAVCEQTEEPQKGKLVDRDVVRTISPGTVIDADVIDGKDNNFLIALHDGGLQGWGLACIDVTTGEFRATWENGPDGWRSILSEIGTLNPSEILIDEGYAHQENLIKELRAYADCMATSLPSSAFSAAILISQKLNAIEIEAGPSKQERSLIECAAGAVIAYLRENQKETLGYVQALEIYRRSQFMSIDKNTERNLEILRGMGEGGKKYSLLGVLDLTVTAMGGRLLKQWLLRPLLDIQKIEARQAMIGFLLEQPTLRDELREALRSVSDIERLLGRVTFGNANARDLAAIRSSLEQVPTLNALLDPQNQDGSIRGTLQRENSNTPEATQAASASPNGEMIDPVMEVRELLAAGVVDEPPLSARDGGMIRAGFDEELDELRAISKDGRGYIAKLQEDERAKTGIPSLKVSYNKVFGYYIEITHTHKDKAPERYIRKQTLTNAERFITPELKEFEAKVLHAEDRIKDVEFQLLQRLLDAVRGYSVRIKATASLLARLDVFQSLAEAASRYQYNRPAMNEGDDILIEEGRHPVIERVPNVDHFVPNDTRLSQESEQILLITGPNMAGKSTYIRQVAIMALMAQTGSFIPAKSASFGIVDRLFSRVGASDDLARGRSTFMVEMSEAAHILKNATPKSLIILDEIGRGTSTFDGISLAWSIVEYLHGLRGKGVKTLFATHYHELAALSETHARTVNQHVQVSEEGGSIRFLYRIAPGYTDHSYGIHVADLAGVPKRVTARARKLLKLLERGEHLVHQPSAPQDDFQISLFTLFEEPIRAKLTDLDMESLSPIEAWQVLQELVADAKAIQS